MERTIKRVDRKLPKQEKLIRTAAYCRVSSDKDAMLHSLSAQVSYFSTTIQNHPGWVYVGAYVDEGITGTKDNRPEFMRLLEDCRKGKIDLVIILICRFRSPHFCRLKSPAFQSNCTFLSPSAKSGLRILLIGGTANRI